MTNKWKCPFERIRNYPDCFQDCPDVGECKMKDSWRQIRPLPKLKSSDIPEIKHDDPYETHKEIKDCACLDSDARRCFELRYQGTTPENEMLMSTEVCGCTCHDKGIDFDGDDVGGEGDD